MTAALAVRNFKFREEETIIIISKKIKVVPPLGTPPPPPAAPHSPPALPAAHLSRAQLWHSGQNLRHAAPRSQPPHPAPPRPAPPRRPPPGPATEAGKGWRRRGSARCLPLARASRRGRPSSSFTRHVLCSPRRRTPAAPGPPRPQVPALARRPSAASPRPRGFRPSPPIGSGGRGNPANGAPRNGE